MFGLILSINSDSAALAAQLRWIRVLCLEFFTCGLANMGFCKLKNAMM